MSKTTPKKLRFLHVTDSHLKDSETVENIDIKINVDKIEQPSRENLLRDTLRSLGEKLQSQDDGFGQLDAVIFSGDGTLRGDADGQLRLRKMLVEELGSVGITNKNIIATPGNHDIVSGSKPSDPDRYKHFKTAWIDTDPVVVPFLDGIHDLNSLSFSDHVLTSPDGEWAIFPINSSNWSQLIIPDKGNKDVALLREYFNANPDPKLSEALEKLCKYDVARVSGNQLRALKKLAKSAKEARIRIAVLHHHLLPVDSREEFKPFADITNLGHLRQVLRELDFHLVVHGHKHVTAAYYDHIYPDKLESAPAHRILTVSGGTFGPTGQHPDNPIRLIEIDETPYAPICRVKNIRTATAGLELNISESQPYRLWEDDPDSMGPVTIYGTSIDDVYARAIQLVKKSPKRTIVCTINFQSTDDSIPFPEKYPYGENPEEKRRWFEDTVRWWQLPVSRIETRIPYIHGSRLKRFAGELNQIDRVISLLRDEKSTSKAIALVVDPSRDFRKNKPFASFCFVQFCLRNDNRLDCIGYYRAQEFHYWWPVNVAELRHLQMDVAKEANLYPGEITTITPFPRVSKDIRQPTTVAVPLIDQWVDNYPGRIATMALAITNPAEESYKDGIIFWKQCHSDLLRAATEFHPDGVQVSIEGLELLKDWISATCKTSEITSDQNRDPQDIKDIINLLEDLLHANKTHQDSPITSIGFNRWKEHVKVKLEELYKLTLQR